jgi:hypothetical protein
LPPRLFAETKERRLKRFLPALFVFGACFLARATRKRVQTTHYIGDDSDIFYFITAGKRPPETKNGAGDFSPAPFLKRLIFPALKGGR